MPQTPDLNGKQVIARAAEILRALEKSLSGLSLAQLVRETNLPRTTVHRLVKALEAQQLVMHADNEIKLGPALARMAAAAHTDFVIIARPAIEALGRRTRETVDVSVYKNLHAISVDQYSSDQELRVVSTVGTAFPVHCTAHGKAILSILPGERLLSALSMPFDKRTDNTLLTQNALLDDIELIQRRGFAIDNEEHAQGVCGLGISFKVGPNDLYAISLAVPALRFEKQLDNFVPFLLRCKAEIDSLLG